MKRVCASALLLALAACSNAPTSDAPAADAARPPAPTALTSGWTVTEGVKTPESIYYDPASGYVFSSQIDGAPDGRDGNGRIMKLNGDGTVVNASFVSGLNAPKGLRACAGTLWTADLDEVLGIDPNSGAITSRVKIAGATFLNDVACDDRAVYVSDMLGNRVYVVRDGKPEIFIDTDDLDYPNGLLVDGDRLIVANWGKPEADFTTKVPGRLVGFNLTTRSQTFLTQGPVGNIDGLESDGLGGYIVSDYNKGTILRVSSGGVTEVRQFKPGAADIGFVPGRNILLVPHMNENTLASYTITADAAK